MPNFSGIYGIRGMRGINQPTNHMSWMEIRRFLCNDWVLSFEILEKDLDIFSLPCTTKNTNAVILQQKFKQNKILQNFAEPKNGNNRSFCGALQWKVSYSIVIYGCQVLSHFLESYGRYLVSCRLHFLFWNNSRKTGQKSWKCPSFDCQLHTFSLTPWSAPLSSSFVTISVWPFNAARWSGVQSSCKRKNNDINTLS